MYFACVYVREGEWGREIERDELRTVLSYSPQREATKAPTVQLPKSPSPPIALEGDQRLHDGVSCHFTDAAPLNTAGLQSSVSLIKIEETF